MMGISATWIEQQIAREIQNIDRYGADIYIQAFGRRILRENKAAVLYAAQNYFSRKGGNLHPEDIYSLRRELRRVSHYFHFYTYVSPAGVDFMETVSRWVLAQEAA